MLLFIDSYDSFTYNLVHYFGEVVDNMEVHRNDMITVDEVLAKKPSGIVLGPGPCDPDSAGICLALAKAAAAENIPLLGVCLGHQTIGQIFGGKIIRAREIMHGKMGTIEHNGESVFKNLPSPYEATRYHSLTIDPETLPDCLEVTARIQNDTTIMGIAHKTLPIHGVQFHPESIASQFGHELIKNFIDIMEAHHV